MSEIDPALRLEGIRPMEMPGEVVLDSLYDESTPAEEAAFQEGLAAIKEVERLGWIEGQAIVL